MNILVLDDNAHRLAFFQNGLRGHKLMVCRHARAAIKALKSSTFDLVFLDHDLTAGRAADPESDENSGSAVARYIADHDIACGLIILHTENRAGRESMESILDACESIPYSKLKKIGLHVILKTALTPQLPLPHGGEGAPDPDRRTSGSPSPPEGEGARG